VVAALEMSGHSDTAAFIPRAGLPSAHALPVTLSSGRTAELARKVAAAKAKRLSCCELFLKGVSACLTLPTLGCAGFINVPSNTRYAIFRFGKLDCEINTPGLHWVTPFYEAVWAFSGTSTHRTSELHVIDAAGNPILVRALLEYSIDDPAALRIACNNSTLVIFNMAEQVGGRRALRGAPQAPPSRAAAPRPSAVPLVLKRAGRARGVHAPAAPRREGPRHPLADARDWRRHGARAVVPAERARACARAALTPCRPIAPPRAPPPSGVR
jgi:hypothetical protein